MYLTRYHMKLGATATCTNRLMEQTKGVLQRSLKGSTRDFFLFDSRFLSKKAAESVASNRVDSIGMVKTNTNVFYKDTIEGLTKNWSGVSYIVLRSMPMVSGGNPLLAVGYKYKSRKVISCVATEGAGSTALCIPYLSKYPYQFSNVSIHPVACLILMSKCFGLVIEVNTHNKSCQLDLVLDNVWVAQCGWLRLCTTVTMGTKINNYWKLFRYGVKRDHYNKFIGIREFL